VVGPPEALAEASLVAAAAFPRWPASLRLHHARVAPRTTTAASTETIFRCRKAIGRPLCPSRGSARLPLIGGARYRSGAAKSGFSPVFPPGQVYHDVSGGTGVGTPPTTPP